MSELELKRLNIELSAHCSYACVGCPNTYMQRPKGHMTQELFKQIYSEIENKVEKVFLWNYGEPLLNPNISAMLAYAAGKKPATALSSTGQRLSFMKSVDELGTLTELIISINGFNEKTYTFHQKNGDLKTVLMGLERIKPIMAKSQTTYTLQTVVNAKNINNLDLINNFASQYGFKKVVLKSFNVMDSSEETKSTFVPTDPKFSRHKTNLSKNIEPPCLNWMVINWNGDVNLCCWDYTSKIVVGNVKSNGVFGVWNSEEMRAIKEKIINKQLPDFCIDCTLNTKIIEWDVK